MDEFQMVDQLLAGNYFVRLGNHHFGLNQSVVVLWVYLWLHFGCRKDLTFRIFAYQSAFLTL
jgi:hypothetical protein